MNILDRLKIAWKAFKLESFETYYNPYHYAGKLRPSKCDLNKDYAGGVKAKEYEVDPCEHDSITCISRLGSVEMSGVHFRCCRVGGNLNIQKTDFCLGKVARKFCFFAHEARRCCSSNISYPFRSDDWNFG